MKDAIILFIYPSHSRPVKFQEGLDSIKNNLARPELAEFVFLCDSDDPEIEKYLEIYRANNVVYYGGTSNNKIHAVNRSMSHAPDKWDIVVVMSDDMRFIQLGFDNIIRNDFAEHFPDGDGCIHYPDQNQGEKCMTMSILGRKYYERRNYIYCPEYVSVECDLEAQEEAQMLGCYKFIEKRIFNHNHPSFDTNIPYDSQYRKTESPDIHESDKLTRKKRKEDNYGMFFDTDKWIIPVLVEKEIAVSPVELSVKEKSILILKRAIAEIEAL